MPKRYALMTDYPGYCRYGWHGLECRFDTAEAAIAYGATDPMQEGWSEWHVLDLETLEIVEEGSSPTKE